MTVVLIVPPTITMLDKESSMNQQKCFKLNKFYTAVLMLSAQNVLAAANFNIVPYGTLPTTVNPGQSVSAYYTLTNMTNAQRSGYFITGLPSTVTQNTSSPNCTNPINLGPHANCLLQFDISGAVSSSFAICKGNSCTTSSTPLNVSESSVNASLNAITAGYYANASGAQAPLTYYTTDFGITWTTSLPPAEGAPTQNSLINGASCTDDSAQFCWLAGVYKSLGAVITSPLVYFTSNGGASWTAGFPTSQGVGDSQLNAISCNGSSGQYCTAAGSYIPASTIAPITYYTTNAGVTWTSSIPAQQGQTSQESTLNGISCNGTQGQYCVAVGSYTNNSSRTQPVSYFSSDSGQTWTAVIPTPQGIIGTLQAVSCSGNTGQYCTAVGYLNNGSHLAPTAYYSTNGGATWTASNPQQQGVTTGNSALNGINCTGDQGQYCMAVGYYSTSTTSPVAYSSTNGGITWTPVIPPHQGDSTRNSALYGVTCRGSTGENCIVSGYFIKVGATNLSPLTYYTTNHGSTWNASEPTQQGNVNLNSNLLAMG